MTLPRDPPPTLRVDIAPDPDPVWRDAILMPLARYNSTEIAPANGRLAAVLLRDPAAGDAILGGLWARSAFDWLFVELLFVPEAARGQGHGASLLAAAETIARDRGCLGIWLDTINPAARAFYLRCGFTVFGEIADQPRGHTRTFLHKRFATDAAPLQTQKSGTLR